LPKTGRIGRCVCCCKAKCFPPQWHTQKIFAGTFVRMSTIIFLYFCLSSSLICSEKIAKQLNLGPSCFASTFVKFPSSSCRNFSWHCPNHVWPLHSRQLPFF